MSDITHEDILKEIKELRKEVQELRGERLSEMTSREYATWQKLKTVNTLYYRIACGLYKTPEGYTEPCFEMKKGRGRIWNAELADKYYDINTKLENDGNKNL